MLELSKTEKAAVCEDFAKRMPELRKIMRITQQKLGELCGYSRIRISNIETGREKLSWHQLMSIALVFIVNTAVKEYMDTQGILDKRFYGYITR